VVLGLEIVGPKLAVLAKEARRVAPGGEVLVHCWRGGMRSGSFAWLLETTSMRVATLQQGYKAYRQEVLRAFEQPMPLVVLGGRTGSGKTDTLKALAQLGEQILDLEGLAHHKGSSFGALGQAPQPTNEQFENCLHGAWRALDPSRRVWVEDESVTIGTVRLPPGLWQQMRAAPVAFLNVCKELRIQRLVREYGQFSLPQLLEAVERIQKRLGGLHYQQAVYALEQGDYAHVANLTLAYYDKAYEYGLTQRDAVRVFDVPVTTDDARANARQLQAWANGRTLGLPLSTAQVKA